MFVLPTPCRGNPGRVVPPIVSMRVEGGQGNANLSFYELIKHKGAHLGAEVRLALCFKSGRSLGVAWLQLQALASRRRGRIGRTTGEGGTIVRNLLRCHVKAEGKNAGTVRCRTPFLVCRRPDRHARASLKRVAEAQDNLQVLSHAKCITYGPGAWCSFRSVAGSLSAGPWAKKARMGAPSRLKSALLLLVCVAGIYGSYLTQGVVQETLSTKKFGADGARFSHLSSLNAVQCWVCFIWAGLLLALFDKRCADVHCCNCCRQPDGSRRPGQRRGSSLAAQQQPLPQSVAPRPYVQCAVPKQACVSAACCRKEGQQQPPFTAYWKPAITNCVGPACGLQALKSISYPAQVPRLLDPVHVQRARVGRQAGYPVPAAAAGGAGVASEPQAPASRSRLVGSP